MLIILNSVVLWFIVISRPQTAGYLPLNGRDTGYKIVMLIETLWGKNLLFYKIYVTPLRIITTKLRIQHEEFQFTW